MALPAIAVAGIAISALSTIGQMFGGYYQGAATEKMNKYKAEQLRKAARSTKLSEQADLRRQKFLTRSAVGSQRASLAGSGVDVNVGSPLDLQVDTGRLGTMDAMQIRSNYAWRRWSMLSEAAGYQFAAEFANRAKWIGMGTNLMQGVGQGAQWYANYSNSKTT